MAGFGTEARAASGRQRTASAVGILPIILAVFVAVSVVVPRGAAAQDDFYDDSDSDEALGSAATVRYFYDDLAPYGEWLQVPVYGWAWRPYGISQEWRPYSQGRWLYTDYGWTWLSDEPWGWAPYHYGRWLWDDRYDRWVWVPGRRWAPAWVDWRQGDDFIGWAPLPPAAVWRPGGFPPRTVIIEPRHYCFVRTRDIAEPGVARYLAPAPRNVTIIHNTTRVTNYTIVNNRIANRSIQETTVERATGQPLPRYPVNEIRDVAPRAFHGAARTARPEPRHVEPRTLGQPSEHVPVPSPPPATNVHRETNPERERMEAERERARVEAESLRRERADRERIDRERFDRARREEAERDRQEIDARERARIDRERAEAMRQESARVREEAGRREAAQANALARQREAERRRETALQRQEAERARQGAERRNEEQAPRRPELQPPHVPPARPPTAATGQPVRPAN